VPWVLSAKTAPALWGQAERLRSFVETSPGLGLADVGLSLATTRAALEHRAVVVAADREAGLEGLWGLASGVGATGMVAGVARPGVRVGVMFPGQGAQRLGMGRELYEAFLVFRAVLDEVCEGLAEEGVDGLREVMWGSDAELLQQTGWAQPALFAVEVALY